MGCPIKELDTSALSASSRRLTEGVLEVEGPTSADAGVASCQLVNAEPVFRRLRDDLLADKIFLVGMTQVGGLQSAKWSVKSAARSSRKLQDTTTVLQKLQAWQEKRRWESDGKSGNSRLLRRTIVALETGHWGKHFATRQLCN